MDYLNNQRPPRAQRRKHRWAKCLSKVRHATELEVFKSASYHAATNGVKLTYYKCEFCNGYHLTSDLNHKGPKR